MTRALPEWIGATPDAILPPRVRIRLFDAAGGRCQNCSRKVGPAGEPFDFDHIVPIVAGGRNAESNFQVLCRHCHRVKTSADVAEKSATAETRKAHILPKPLSKWGCGRGSKWKRKMDGSVVAR